MTDMKTSDLISIAVVGAHLTGLPLNHELSANGGRLVRSARTAGEYRLFALPGTVPPKPGMVRFPGAEGPGLEVEVWELPADAFGRFVAKIPAPLGIGKVTLSDGTQVSGFLCEAYAIAGAEDITDYGGWRNYLARQAA
jgi:allophanate hydrolase